MIEFLKGSAYFGTVLSMIGFAIGSWANRRLKSPLVNPLLVGAVFVAGMLLILRMDYATYQQTAGYISYFLTPATACLAIPMYRKLDLLKKNLKRVLIGTLCGTLMSFLTVWLVCRLFRLGHADYVTLLPRSVTTAIGMDLAREAGGNASIASAVIICTGICGNITCTLWIRLFRKKDPVATGIAIGTASHAIGTAKALELGETEGAFSGLAIAVSGIMTSVLFPLFAGLL